jgi:hypothetical protein
MLNILQNIKTQLKDGGADALVRSFSHERWPARLKLRVLTLAILQAGTKPL